MSFNLSEIIDTFWNASVANTWDLLWWNTIQAYASQPDCPVSKVSGTTNVVTPCWDLAWIFRPIIIMPMLTVLYIGIALTMIIWVISKEAMESSGSYKTI